MLRNIKFIFANIKHISGIRFSVETFVMKILIKTEI